MTDEHKHPAGKSEDHLGNVRMGREALSKVFRSEGGSELSSHHNKRLARTDSAPVTGPRVLHEMVDGAGPTDIRQIEASLPGPTLHNAMTDSEGPSDLREIRDAEGPVVPRKRLEDHNFRQATQDLSAASSQHPEQSVPASKKPVEQPANIHLETYSIHMEDRLAKVKASQKETLEKLLGADEAQSDSPVPQKQASPQAQSAGLMKDIPHERHLLRPSHLHPAIRASVALHHRDIVDEVLQAISSHKVVVVGMGGNPFVSRSRKLLSHAGIDHHYLGYGNYLSGWRRRNALKMWTGWPTFPMIFIRGMLIGGHNDLKTLMVSGDLAAVLED